MPPKRQHPEPPAAPEPQFRPRRHSAQAARHGGAWKVAYADFVTALMALFIVLWMMSSSAAVKQSITGYFRDPRGYSDKLGAGPGGSGEGLRVGRENVSDLRKKMEESLRRMPDLKAVRNNVRFSVTGEGLRVELLESEQGMFFVAGSPSPTPAGENLLRLLASELARLPNGVVIEGHSDSRPFRNPGSANIYGNWELSTDRANAARRLLLSSGLQPRQVAEVRGFADQKLLTPGEPENPKNRRVSVVVKFQAE
jgi:chemotaxis protein MotB